MGLFKKKDKGPDKQIDKGQIAEGLKGIGLELTPAQRKTVAEKIAKMLAPSKYDGIKRHILPCTASALVAAGATAFIWGGPNAEQKEKIENHDQAVLVAQGAVEQAKQRVAQAETDAKAQIDKAYKDANRPKPNFFNTAKVRLKGGKNELTSPLRYLKIAGNDELAFVFDAAADASLSQSFPEANLSETSADFMDGRLFIASADLLRHFDQIRGAIRAADSDPMTLPGNVPVAYRVSQDGQELVLIRDIDGDDKKTPSDRNNPQSPVKQGDMEEIFRIDL